MNFLDNRQNELMHYEEDDNILQAVSYAHGEWVDAQNYFNNVSEPELVDYAIYKMEAAKKKYIYLLKQARLRGIEGVQTLQHFNG